MPIVYLLVVCAPLRQLIADPRYRVAPVKYLGYWSLRERSEPAFLSVSVTYVSLFACFAAYSSGQPPSTELPGGALASVRMSRKFM